MRSSRNLHETVKVEQKELNSCRLRRTGAAKLILQTHLFVAVDVYEHLKLIQRVRLNVQLGCICSARSQENTSYDHGFDCDWLFSLFLSFKDCMLGEVTSGGVTLTDYKKTKPSMDIHNSSRFQASQIRLTE